MLSLSRKQHLVIFNSTSVFPLFYFSFKFVCVCVCKREILFVSLLLPSIYGRGNWFLFFVLLQHFLLKFILRCKEKNCRKKSKKKKRSIFNKLNVALPCDPAICSVYTGVQQQNRLKELKTGVQQQKTVHKCSQQHYS